MNISDEKYNKTPMFSLLVKFYSWQCTWQKYCTLHVPRFFQKATFALPHFSKTDISHLLMTRDLVKSFLYFHANGELSCIVLIYYYVDKDLYNMKLRWGTDLWFGFNNRQNMQVLQCMLVSFTSNIRILCQKVWKFDLLLFPFRLLLR